MNTGAELKKAVEEKGEAITAAVSDAVDRVVNLNGKIEEQVDSALKRARKAGHTVDSFAKENPWQFAGVALAVGFLAGWLIKSRD
jgi:ElaB/YqjD/DUF883 family membrane-anchored ribosome-binding protein